MIPFPMSAKKSIPDKKRRSKGKGSNPRPWKRRQVPKFLTTGLGFGNLSTALGYNLGRSSSSLLQKVGPGGWPRNQDCVPTKIEGLERSWNGKGIVFLDSWLADWFPKVEKEESRKWEPVLREDSKRQGTKFLTPQRNKEQPCNGKVFLANEPQLETDES